MKAEGAGNPVTGINRAAERVSEVIVETSLVWQPVEHIRVSRQHCNWKHECTGNSLYATEIYRTLQAWAHQHRWLCVCSIPIWPSLTSLLSGEYQTCDQQCFVNGIILFLHVWIYVCTARSCMWFILTITTNFSTVNYYCYMHILGSGLWFVYASAHISPHAQSVCWYWAMELWLTTQCVAPQPNQYSSLVLTWSTSKLVTLQIPTLQQCVAIQELKPSVLLGWRMMCTINKG